MLQFSKSSLRLGRSFPGLSCATQRYTVLPRFPNNSTSGTRVFSRSLTRKSGTDLAMAKPKRKRSEVTQPATAATAQQEVQPRPKPGRQPSRRGKVDTNPDHNAAIIDAPEALRASPDADEKGESFDIKKPVGAPPKPNKSPTKSSIAAKKGSDEIKAFKAEQAAKKAAEAKIKKEDGGENESLVREDPDGEGDAVVEDADTMKREAARPPPVNSDYLPLPWKGRLGYVRSPFFPGFRLFCHSFEGLSKLYRRV